MNERMGPVRVCFVFTSAGGSETVNVTIQTMMKGVDRPAAGD